MLKVMYNPTPEALSRTINRQPADTSDVEVFVESVYERVSKDGDKALFELTDNLDGVNLSKLSIRQKELNNLAKRANEDVKNALKEAMINIEMVHSLQGMTDGVVVPSAGIKCWRETRPIERIGVYVPGGSAPLVSTVLMLLVPAKIAGCKEIIVCTPPTKSGDIDANMAYAFELCGVNEVYLLGGAQAIAALALGTESVPKVFKIFGPGNKYVTAAKQLAINYGCAIDMPAGPSEVMVVADQNANPKFVAADLLSQAEHDPDSQTVLVTTKKEMAEQVRQEIKGQLKYLPRQNIALRALKNSYAMVFDSASDCINYINEYSPEHLILSVKRPLLIARQINNAGSVFLGNYSPESAGDYASGTNHTLPTNGWAKSVSGLGVEAFQKQIYFQRLSKAGLFNIRKTINALAEAEGLQAHAKAVNIRYNGE